MNSSAKHRTTPKSAKGQPAAKHDKTHPSGKSADHQPHREPAGDHAGDLVEDPAGTSADHQPPAEAAGEVVEDQTAAQRLPLAFPVPPPRPPGPIVPAFPGPPARPVTPATRAFPPADASTLRFGENVLRDARAGEAPAARFDVDLRRRQALPASLIAQVRAEAEAAGYAAGWAQGRREAQAASLAAADNAAMDAADARATQAARVEQALIALASAATSLERRAIPTVRDIEDTIADTALEIASAVLAHELAVTAEPGRAAVARALALTPTQRPVTVRLNPVDRLTMGTSELVMDGRTITLVDDPTLRSGDAVAQCDATTIDARLEPALQRVREALKR
jgi:flagellar assembly protein FliH